MGELTEMFRNILDMECSHIKAGYITKEFAGKAMTAFVEGLMTKGETENEINCNRLLKYWAKWAELYIENVNIKEGGKK